MKHSLMWRFLVIIGVTALAALMVATHWPPNLGIDLAGGTSLLYELDVSKLKESNQNYGELAGRVIDVLRQRVDPKGQKNIIWRIVGHKRIQIQMPFASKKVTLAREERDAAEADLRSSMIKPSEILAAIGRSGADREAEVEKLIAKVTKDSPAVIRASDQYKKIMELAAANDRLNAAKAAEAKYPLGQAPEAVRKEKFDAQTAFDNAQQAVNASNVDMGRLQTLMTAAESPDNKEAQDELAKLPAQFPLQKAKIERLIKAHQTYNDLNGGGVDDPTELQRLVTQAGVLDFRIAVVETELKPGSDEYVAALQSLQQYGPDHQVSVNGTKARWFEIDPNGKDNFRDGGYVIETWAGQPYILCYDDTERSLTHSDPKRKPWSVTANTPYSDPQQGGLVLPFNLDNVGAKYMGQLTGDNKGHPMAILLDDRAMSAPNINSQITDSGIISFGQPTATHSLDMIKKEADQLKQIMDAGSLPATLQSQPISVRQITSDMGDDNITAGIHSAYYAVVAVVGFMLVYYTITGAFADLALMLNLLLVLAAMAFFHGTFTLPGIAGLVLTLGMAVDANVLINERIREEVHKGASLWMAIKQGYDKVFWTIFDANLTCSLTSIVLIYVGSEEVKGFGITLLIGLAIHMFTALFVTRTFMMAAVKWGVLRAIDDHSLTEYLKEIFTFTWLRNGHFPFMRVITVTNIDWIGKRHIFWGMSAVVIVAGTVVFFARGEDKYDIEFRGGTQVTINLKPDAKGHYLTREEVEQRIKSLDTTPGLKELNTARVYGVGKPEEHSFEMQTTIANTETSNIQQTLLAPLAAKFSDVLETTPKVHFAHDNVQEKDIGDLINEGVVRPITAGSLDQVFAGTNVTGIPVHDVTNYLKGVAILMDDMKPPQTAAQLTDRIKATRQSPDVSATTPYREFEIIPITAVAGGPSDNPRTEPAAGDDKRPLTRAVMVSLDSSHPYDENAENIWQTRVAASEWKVLRTSLANESLFQGVTSFDAVVASQAKMQALIAIVLSLILIVIYVWVRFGGIWYGFGAILSLVHDAVVAVAVTVLSGIVYNYVFERHSFLLITDFKINLTMIAAYLTIIGYSVNDTIVIFDRVRELRGKSHAPLTKKLVNDAINQCFGRTIWTTFTVFIVVLIMYIWGGEGVRGFSFAMLVGVITGAYSTLAIASPMLLTTSAGAAPSGGSPGGENPFLTKGPNGESPVRRLKPVPDDESDAT